MQPRISKTIIIYAVLRSIIVFLAECWRHDIENDYVTIKNITQSLSDKIHGQIIRILFRISRTMPFAGAKKNGKP